MYMYTEPQKKRYIVYNQIIYRKKNETLSFVVRNVILGV